MSESQSLAELRAQIEAEEAQANAVQAEVTEAEEVEETEEVETEAEEVEQESVTEEGEAEEAEEQPEWAKAESDPKDLVPLAKHLDVKFKLRGEVAEEKRKADELAAENAALKQQLQQVQGPSLDDLEIAKEAWEFDGTTEEYQRYKAQIDARNAIKLQRAEQQRQANEQHQREEAARVEAELDKHYERATELVTSGIIKQPEQFKAAEQTVIKSVDSIVPGVGSEIVKMMISRLGVGSEKVIFHLGTNSVERQKFENELRSDSTGFKAAMFLAEKKALFNSKPVVKPKPVPKPDVPLQGKAPKVSSYETAFKKAEKAGDTSAMLAASRAARAAGINPDNW